MIKTFKADPNAESISFQYKENIEEGAWFALRVFGRKHAMAHSGPIYVHVGESTHLSKKKAPSIVAKIIKELGASRQTPDPIAELEYWQVKPGFDKHWQTQRDEICRRIDQALEKYRLLVMSM